MYSPSTPLCFKRFLLALASPADEIQPIYKPDFVLPDIYIAQLIISGLHLRKPSNGTTARPLSFLPLATANPFVSASPRLPSYSSLASSSQYSATAKPR